ncbi:MAG: YdcF family protein [Buchananella hordeovulneris]|nr:YdcF family protein [Buchananella hordeovulneris]
MGCHDRKPDYPAHVRPSLSWLGNGLVAFVGYSRLYGLYTKKFGGTVDAVVVLGAGVPDGEVRPLLASRIEQGIAWMERDHARGGNAALLMSGGQGSDEPLPEGKAMALWAVEHGVDAGHVLVEDASTTTQQNLQFSSQLLRERGLTGAVAVVTSNYHAFRRATLTRELSIPGYSVGADTARYYVPAALLREYVAILRDNRTLNIVALVLLSLPALLGIFVYLTSW